MFVHFNDDIQLQKTEATVLSKESRSDGTLPVTCESTPVQDDPLEHPR